MMKKGLMICIILALLTLIAAVGMAQDTPMTEGITHGPLSGEVTDSSVILWARGAEAGTLTFTISADDAEVATASVEVDASSDFTGEVLVEGLDAATAYTFTAHLGDMDGVGEGSFMTAPADAAAAAFDFVFGACLGGQGYCRNPETGWVIFDTMLAQSPDFFLLTGDGVYVDAVCPADAGQNVPGAETVATDLQGFYGRYKYHLEDNLYSTFLAQTPVYVTWDDHEILDNFGGPELSRINPAMYAEGRQAFFDYWPLPADSEIYRSFDYGAHADFFVLDTRSYRDPLVNWDPNPVTGQPKTMLGADQFAWLQGELAQSDATWKFIVTSVPISYPTGFPQPQVDGRDSWANGNDRSGYETEMMRLLFFLESEGIENVVFITGDTHWPFMIEYDPDVDGDVDFYEIGASPMAAIPLPPTGVDQTFNPNVLYAEGEFGGDLFNFGQIVVDEDGTLTSRIVDATGAVRFEMVLEPR